MKNIRLLPACILAAVLAACAAPKPNAIQPAVTSPAIAPPTAEWLASAQLIETKNLKVYYAGTAQGDYTADHKEWHGTITGRVYVIEANGSSVNLHGGTLHIAAGDVIHSSGPATIHVPDQPPAGGNQ